MFTIFAGPIYEVTFHDCSVFSKSCFELVFVDQVWIEFSDKHRDGINLDSLDTWNNAGCREITRPIGGPGTMMAKILKGCA